MSTQGQLLRNAKRGISVWEIVVPSEQAEGIVMSHLMLLHDGPEVRQHTIASGPIYLEFLR